MPSDPPANFFDQMPDSIIVPVDPWPEEPPEHDPDQETHVNGSALNGLPSIQIIEGELSKQATWGEEAVLQTGIPLFQRGRELVKPVHQDVPASKGRMTLSAGMAKVSTAGMVDILGRAARWTRWDGRKKKEVNTDPTDRIANILLSRVGEWGFQTLAGVITTPTMRHDGTILHKGGYDPTTRLYHYRDPGLKPSYIPADPTKLDAERSIQTLNGLLDEFPFVSDLDRSVALSALITPVIRGALTVAPLHAIKANTAGSGKSYLADVASAIATGRPCPVISVSTEDKETEARLTGMLLAATPLISLDNVNGELGGDLLCQAVERPTVQVRRLGASDIFEIESRATFFATGNGLRIRGDMTRRTVLCNLDAGVERPESREFHHSPVDDVLADRGLYIAAILTICRAYMVADRPGLLRPLASFEQWSDLVRSALVWLGMPDPVLSIETTREDDPELTALRDILVCWHAAMGSRELTIREVIETANRRKITFMGETDDLEHPDLHDALLAVGSVRGNIDAGKLGRWMMAREGRIAEGLRLRRTGRDAHSKVARWRVV